MTAPGRRIDTPELFAEEFSVSRETVSRLKTYEDLLKRWQKTINLVAPGTLGDIWHRHFADSAQLWRLGNLAESPAGVWLDFGSGAGFPGLVLAIMAAEKAATRHILIESDSRKAAFLREVARHTGVAVDILCTRIESTETLAKVEPASCVTARALAPLPRLAGLVAPYFESSTRGLFLKGREVGAELEEARRDWDFEFNLVPSLTETDARIVVLHGLQAKSLRITT
ncbi:MAG: 16S rRNA (guanine(527)-N(7))-methyltransferase RsmG [Hyphomicrobium sp.]|nr:16S rRNA (guanine(527)-N(7))-methyltransferase RsmG [Hyphomicrobium sp.]